MGRGGVEDGGSRGMLGRQKTRRQGLKLGMCACMCVFLPAEGKVCTWGGGWLRADSDSLCFLSDRAKINLRLRPHLSMELQHMDTYLQTGISDTHRPHALSPHDGETGRLEKKKD